MIDSRPDFDGWWDYSNPAATEVKFRELLPAAAAGGDRSYFLQLLTQIARAQGLLSRFDQGHATLDEVEKQLAPQLTLPHVRYLLERGRLYNSSGQPAPARPLFVQAFELASREKLDYYAVDAAHMLGIVEPTPAAQMEWNRRALEIAEKSTDPRARGWAGALYNNMGWSYFDQKEYDKALELFQKGVEFRAQAQQPRQLRIAKYAVARTLRAMGRLDEALKLIEAVHAESMAAGDSAPYIDEELAECLLADGKPAQAGPLFARAHELLSKDPWLVKNEPDRLARLLRLGSDAP